MNDALGEEPRGAATSWLADSHLDDVGTRSRGDRHINSPIDVGRWLDRRLNTIAISPHFAAFNIIQADIVLASGGAKIGPMEFENGGKCIPGNALAAWSNLNSISTHHFWRYVPAWIARRHPPAKPQFPLGY